MHNNLAFLFTLLLWSGLVSADDMSVISQRLLQPEVFSVEFVQKKEIKILSQPLVSTGKLWVEQKRGVVWQTEKPIFSQVVIAQQGVSFSDMQARRTIKSMEFLANIMQVVLSGDLKNIEEHFNVSVVNVGNKEKQWVIELEPKSTLIKKGVKNIRMSGGSHVSQIILREASGDQTEINFHDLSVIDRFPVELIGVFEKI